MRETITAPPFEQVYLNYMADVIEILKSSGPISLDELNLRTSASPAELALRLAGLRKSGQINVCGVEDADLAKLSDDRVQTASDIVIELSNKAIRRLTR